MVQALSHGFEREAGPRRCLLLCDTFEGWNTLGWVGAKQPFWDWRSHEDPGPPPPHILLSVGGRGHQGTGCQFHFPTLLGPVPSLPLLLRVVGAKQQGQASWVVLTPPQRPSPHPASIRPCLWPSDSLPAPLACQARLGWVLSPRRTGHCCRHRTCPSTLKPGVHPPRSRVCLGEKGGATVQHRDSGSHTHDFEFTHARHHSSALPVLSCKRHNPKGGHGGPSHLQMRNPRSRER